MERRDCGVSPVVSLVGFLFSNNLTLSPSRAGLESSHCVSSFASSSTVLCKDRRVGDGEGGMCESKVCPSLSPLSWA